jgi:hypothetical protein
LEQCGKSASTENTENTLKGNFPSVFSVVEEGPLTENTENRFELSVVIIRHIPKVVGMKAVVKTEWGH